eukprot:1891269-Rhodomonas_salina.2
MAVLWAQDNSVSLGGLFGGVAGVDGIGFKEFQVSSGSAVAAGMLGHGVGGRGPRAHASSHPTEHRSVPDYAVIGKRNGGRGKEGWCEGGRWKCERENGGMEDEAV